MQSPHDTLFRFTFCHAVHAASWLRRIAPGRVRRAIDWATLVPANERLPGPRLRPHFADLVFAADRRSGGRPILLLVEHKSRFEAGLERQLLRYAVLLQHGWRQRDDVVPEVLGFVLLHGERGAPGSQAAQPRNPSPTDVPAAFERWRELLAAVDRTEAPPHTPPLGRDAVEAIGWYALAVTDVTPEALSDTFARILHRPEDTIMSTLERTYQQGKNEGKAEGKAEGRAEALLRLLHKRFGPVDPASETRVRRATIADLDRWTDRVLDAATLAGVLAD
ncbi:MAG: Rpn family recombination-promoting nuclease/putative transposase [Planctomycetes bacterium]|nr:Rpn family recombination-promoting nuclease/putative transposase [Planctomycetota bacterium]